MRASILMMIEIACGIAASGQRARRMKNMPVNWPHGQRQLEERVIKSV